MKGDHGRSVSIARIQPSHNSPVTAFCRAGYAGRYPVEPATASRRFAPPFLFARYAAGLKYCAHQCSALLYLSSAIWCISSSSPSRITVA